MLPRERQIDHDLKLRLKFKQSFQYLTDTKDSQATPGTKSLPIPIVIIKENIITTSHAFDFTK